MVFGAPPRRQVGLLSRLVTLALITRDGRALILLRKLRCPWYDQWYFWS